MGYEIVPFDRDTPVESTILKGVTHVLSSVAPDSRGDPVLDAHGADLRGSRTLYWAGYLSSTAVYGSHESGWVDENTPPEPTSERGIARVAAEQAWAASGLPAHTFRLSGIYGPGRNVLRELRNGTARIIVKPGHVFSRIHVDDIVATLETSIARPAPGAVYNVSDDEPAPSSDVVAYGAWLLDVEPPPIEAFEDAVMSVALRSFYAENRWVSNVRIRDELGVDLEYPTYREGLTALLETERA